MLHTPVPSFTAPGFSPNINGLLVVDSCNGTQYIFNILFTNKANFPQAAIMDFHNNHFWPTKIFKVLEKVIFSHNVH